MDPLASLALQGGGWGLVSLTVIALIRGWLIPRGTHREITGLLGQANAALEATVAEQKRQIDILMLGRTRDPVP